MPTKMPNRRHFLRGLGGVCLALPSFESLQGTEFNASKAKRFVCVSPNYGMHPSGFFPEKTGDDYVMPKLLKPLEKHRSDFSVFNNLDHPGVGGGHGCSNTFLNGMELRDTKDQPQRLHSLDQLLSEKIGQQTRFPSLRLGAGGVSWSRAGIILPTEGSPSKIFAKLFLEDNPKVKASQRKFLDEDGSILDVVYADAKRLGARMAKIDQAKLDEYLTAVREVERKLQRRATWIDVPKPQASSKVIEGNDELVVDLNYPYNTPVMYDLVVLALQTQSSNVITFGHPGGNRLFPFEGVELGYHSLTHHGKRPDLLRQLTIIESYYIRHFARFLDRMKATKDADGRSLLESTVILFGSGMGNASSHSSRNLPILLSGGGFKTGQHHRFERIGRDGRPLCDLFVSILQRLGVETDRFSTSKGNLNHLIA
ncbi:MAG TPA: hypothetical protein DCO70_02260 [Verrucomicrobiales bacterium]|nr:hypothetical protein [Verrucomicrobiales bacterium]|tara:strand:- start:1184 stop:2458 length:1275 start_codon:yes stop_codon:yes gene_type:complete